MVLTPATYCRELDLDELVAFDSCPYAYWSRTLLGRTGSKPQVVIARQIAHEAALQVLREQQQSGTPLAEADVEAVVREVGGERGNTAPVDHALRLVDAWHRAFGTAMQATAVARRWRLECDTRAHWAVTGTVDAVVAATICEQPILLQFVERLQPAAELAAALPLAVVAVGARHWFELSDLTSLSVQQVDDTGASQAVAVPLDDRREREALTWLQSQRASLVGQLSYVTGALPWPPRRSSACGSCAFVKACGATFGAP